MTGACLQVEELVAGYEPGVPVVQGASFSVAAGEILAILGPNGAGKSTLVKAVAGLVPITSGRVALDSVEFTTLATHLRTAQGLAYVPQIDNVFATLSVEDNLAVAALAGSRAARRARVQEALAGFPDLAARRSQLAGKLSGGQRQMLAVARALIERPQLLLLDEPSAGLAPKIVGQLFERVRAIAASGVGVVLVEQNVRAALAVADRVLVLVQGRNCMQGTPTQLAADPALAALYVGGAAGVTG